MVFGVIIEIDPNFFTIKIDDIEIDVQKKEIDFDFMPCEGDFVRVNYDNEKKIESIQPKVREKFYSDKISKICDGIVIVGHETVIIDNLDGLKVGDKLVCDRINGDYASDNYDAFRYRCISFRKIKCGSEEYQVSRSSQFLANSSKKQYNRNGEKVNVRKDFLDIPYELKALMIDEKKSHFIHNKLNEFIPSELNFATYEQIFHNLVHLIELNMQKEFEKYARKEAYFKPENVTKLLFTLEFRRLQELRPSIEKGDTVIATQIDPPNRIFIGKIKKTKQSHMVIKFDDDFAAEFDPIDLKAFSVKFSKSRCIYLRMHKGIRRAVLRLGEDFLFPSEIRIAISILLNVELDGGMLTMDDTVIPWFNKAVDDTQKRAVVQVLRANFRPLPNIIYGPPGSGKTSTLIEIILHVFTQLKTSRILIAVHSNSAANLILTRLLEYEFLRKDILRLLSLAYLEKDEMPVELHPYCCTIFNNRNPEKKMKESVTGIKIGCRLDYVRPFRVVVGTCIGIGALMNDRKNSINYTHVFIDEASQSSEPEVMIPISFVDSKTGSVILAGDPMQIAPLVLCTHAKKRGLAMSMLERFVERYRTISVELEKKNIENHYNVHLISKLLYNYRSVPSILQFYSKHFYDSALIPTIVSSESLEMQILAKIHSHKLIPCNTKRNLKHAIYFCNVLGENRQVADNNSWCNTEEASEIIKFVPKLLKLGLNGDDIAVITPYHSQVSIIKESIKFHKFQIEVSSVDQFQGLEKQVILISTVRTNKRVARMDMLRNLGIVACPKRTNVAISRARALVVIFGKAELLVRDKYWSHLIEDCKNNGTFFDDIQFNCNHPKY